MPKVSIVFALLCGAFGAHADPPAHVEPQTDAESASAVVIEAEYIIREIATNDAPVEKLDESGWDGVVEIGDPSLFDKVASRGNHGRAGHSCSQNGQASWYGPGFHGHKTASGERFNRHALTAAHPHLPMGTHVRVTNRRSGRSIVVRINDRGPYAGGRIIDLSQAAASAIGLGGTGPVQIQCA